MARDYEKQHLFQENGYAVDCGYIPFVTTGATLEVYTPLSKIYFAEYMFVCSTADINPAPGESLYIADTVGATDGAITVSGNKVTIGRTGADFVVSTKFGIDDFTSNDDLIECVLFTAPFDLTLVEAEWSNSVGVFTGSPLLNVGTTTTDPDEFIDAQAITVTTLVTTTITTFAATAISDGDIIRCLTTGGTGAPFHANLTLKMTRALSSATKVFYKFIGID